MKKIRNPKSEIRKKSTVGFPPLALICILAFGLFASALPAAAQTLDSGPDNAVRFDGTNDTGIISLGSGLIANTSTISIEGWVFPESTAPGFPDFDQFFGVRNDVNADFYILQLSATSLEARFTNSAGTSFTITSTTGFQVNRWNHVALVYDGTTMRLYVNGRSVGALAANGQITNIAEPFRIAHGHSVGSRFQFKGQLDELRIWRTARNIDEIPQNIHRNITSAPNLVGSFRFAESAGTDTSKNFAGDTNIQFGNVDSATIWVTSRALVADSRVQAETSIGAVWDGAPVSQSTNGFTATQLTGGLSLAAIGISDSLTYAIFGNDNGAGTTTANPPTSGNTTNFLRLSRTWLVAKTGSVTANITFSPTAIGAAALSGLTASRYLLLGRASNSGPFSVINSGANVVVGDTVTFNSVSLTDSLRYTLGIVDPADTPRVRFLATSPFETTATTFTLRVAIDSGIVGDSVRLVVNGTIIDTKTMSATAETLSLTCTLTANSNTVVARYIRSSDSSVIADTITITLGVSSLTLVDSATFLFSPGAFSTESAQVRVRDALGNNLAGIAVTYTVVTKPTGATGESLDSSVSDASGISRVRLKAGNKTGVYIVKAQISGISLVYLCYATNEYDLPATTWRMITLNRAPTNAQIANALSINPGNLFHWNPLAEFSARNLRYEAPTSLAVGEGYFMYEANATRITVNGTTLFTDTRDIALKADWNQIGAPYNYLTRYLSARILTSSGTELSLTDAAAQGIIVNSIFWYKDNAYQWGPNSTNADPMLAPWTGFWIKAAANATLRLSPYFYYSESTTAPLVSAQATGDVNNWKIKITSTLSSGAQLVNVLGVSPTATENADFGQDIENAPLFSGMVAAGLGLGGAFAQDLRAPFTTANQWLFAVTASNADTTVTLAFGDLANLPADFVVKLVDLASNAITDVRSSPTYQYFSSSASARSFRIVAGTEAAVRSALAQALDASQTYADPNPGPGADGMVRFKYNTTAGGTLRLRIFDLAGRKVIDRNIDLNAFPTEYAWNCGNDRGMRVATGVYIYVMDFGSATTSRRMTDKLAIVR